MSKKSWQVMYKFIRRLNLVFAVGVILYALYTSWPFIKIEALELRNKLTPGPIVFNSLMILIPPYKLRNSHYVASSLPSFREKTKAEPVFSKYETYLEIPSVHIRGQVVDGADEKAMDLGFWHYPGTGDIKHGGNIVIVGHRYLKLPPAQDTFFNLDKVKLGDRILLKNRLGEWQFVVISKRIVAVDEVSLLLNSSNQLTLITCHPVWTSKARLVVIAKPVRQSEFKENLF